jgi:hypothetical protein
MITAKKGSRRKRDHGGKEITAEKRSRRKGITAERDHGKGDRGGKGITA